VLFGFQAAHVAVNRRTSIGLHSLRLRLRTRKRRHAQLNCTPPPQGKMMSSISVLRHSPLMVLITELLILSWAADISINFVNVTIITCHLPAVHVRFFC